MMSEPMVCCLVEAPTTAIERGFMILSRMFIGVRSMDGIEGWIRDGLRRKNKHANQVVRRFSGANLSSLSHDGRLAMQAKANSLSRRYVVEVEKRCCLP